MIFLGELKINNHHKIDSLYKKTFYFYNSPFKKKFIYLFLYIYIYVLIDFFFEK